ncbi:hypothetical protein OHU11_42030 (plasmid) [Streptomyces sp. NBC_00257]|nr:MULTISPECIES: hypothetical protein [unclassified Streptomyces]MCX5434760.1 hypothetical protein [Streptomyces sp. NBC_00062]
MLAGLRTCLATYSARQAEQGLHELSRSAAADMAAFLTTTTGALA